VSCRLPLPSIQSTGTHSITQSCLDPLPLWFS